MQIMINVPARRIADMMVGAIEGNHMTRAWCAGVFLKGMWERQLKGFDGCWYDHAPVFEDGFTVEIHEIADESKPAEGNNIVRHRRNADDFRKGLALMASKHGRHFGDMMAENDDNVTQDVFLQCIALGEVRYG